MDEHFDLDLTYITDRIIGKAYFGGAGLGYVYAVHSSQLLELPTCGSDVWVV